MLDLLIVLQKHGCCLTKDGNSLRVSLGDKYLGHICNSDTVPDDTPITPLTSLKQAIEILIGEPNGTTAHTTTKVGV